MHKSRGLTLLELLIGIALQCFLASIVVVVLANFSRHYAQQLRILKTQQQLLTSIYLLREEIHHAGYWGCQTLPIDLALSFPGKHHMRIQHANTDGAKLIEMQNSSTLVVTDNRLNIKHTWMIADCKHQETFEIVEAHSHQGKRLITTRHPLRYRYFKQSIVAPVETLEFYQSGMKLLMQRQFEAPLVLIDKITDLSLVRANQDPQYLTVKITIGAKQYVLYNKIFNQPGDDFTHVTNKPFHNIASYASTFT